jgi:DNA-binding MarR family transcriptional regulator
VNPPDRAVLSAPDALGELIGLLPRVLRGMRRIKTEGDAEGLARAGELGPRHGKTLYLLLDGPKTVGDLAVELDLTLASTSNLVADLDRAGLAERRQDPADRRRTIVSIVDERRPAVEAWLSAATAPLARALEGVAPEERATFIKVLHALADELGPGDEPH